jgi:O-antigen/teichoic acid export membrane protein/thiamine kinase-like enzyme
LNRNSIGHPLDRLIAHVRVPLFRNAYALILSSATTSGFGLVYWILAARNYTTESVGLNSAVIFAMIFLANLSHFNLTNALNRFLPRAGGATGRIILYFYLISLTAALGSSLIFLLFIEAWSPALGFLKSTPYSILGFILATMTWCIFSLQDSAFVGLRRATWVPIENLIFALSKIGLLVGFASVLPQFGIFASWTLSVAVLILPVNILIFRGLVPKHVIVTAGRAAPVLPSRVVKFVAGDYFASLIGTTSFILLPLIVLERFGASANAYYSMSWTMAYSLYLVCQNMGMSLIAEAAADQTKLNIYSFRAFIQSLRLIVPAVALMVLGAPYILRLFGQEYATEGTLVLRLLCLSALPNIITSLYISIVRVQRRMKALILVLTSLSFLVLTLSYILLGIYGITGIGLAWLLSQTAVAAVLMATQLGRLWLPHLNVQFPLRLLAIPRGLWWHWRQRRRKADIAKMVPEILSVISPLADTPHPTTWGVQGLVRTLNDVTVVTLGPRGLPPVALLKLPRTDAAAMSLKQQRAVLTRLYTDPRVGPWRALLPRQLAADETADKFYLVEQMLPGLEAHRMVSEADTRMRMQTAAVAAISDLHHRTAVSVAVDAAMLERWVDRPISVMRDLLASGKPAIDYQRVFDRLMTELHDALMGRMLSVSWVHGDFTPGNILLTPDAAAVTGILDWDQAAPQNLPQLDLALLFLSTRMLERRCELGDVVREILNAGEWSVPEDDLLNTAQMSLPGAAVGVREMVLLSWLRHAESNLTKAIRYKDNWLWTAKNIESVLQGL